MLLRLAGIFGWREREITTVKISVCRTKRNAGHGHPVLLPTALTVTLLTPQVVTVPTITPLIHQALTVRIPTVHNPLILPAPTK